MITTGMVVVAADAPGVWRVEAADPGGYLLVPVDVDAVGWLWFERGVDAERLVRNAGRVTPVR